MKDEDALFVSLLWSSVLMFIPMLLGLGYSLWFFLLYIIIIPMACIPLLWRKKEN